MKERKNKTMKNNKTIIYLDMDGTIADLYGIADWLPRLRNEDNSVFEECKPLITEEELQRYFPTAKYDIRICSMTPKGATKEYCENVISQKNRWLNEYFPSISKRYYLPYGTNKNYKNSRSHILVDDNELIRSNYRGKALYPMWL